jgi:hypothetical protein
VKANRSDTPDAQPPIDPAAIRNHWHSVILSECMRCAALLNLVPWGESDIRKLPANVHEFALRFCADLLERMCKAELALKYRPQRLEKQVAQDVWNALKPFAVKGEHYVGHLAPTADVPRETPDSKHSTDKATS